MRSILILMHAFLIFTTESCVQDKKHEKHLDAVQGKSIEPGSYPSKSLNSVTVFKEHFIVSIEGLSGKAATQEQLLALLRNYKSNDTLLIVIKDAPEQQIESVLKSLHHLNIVRYRVEVTEDYFKLPYN